MYLFLLSGCVTIVSAGMVGRSPYVKPAKFVDLMLSVVPALYKGLHIRTAPPLSIKLRDWLGFPRRFFLQFKVIM